MLSGAALGASVLAACLGLATLGKAQPDDHTVALWLADEPQYLNMTLTDASPHQYDLRLMEAGVMEAGRYGGCVGRRPGSEGQAVCYAEERATYDNGPPQPSKSRVSVAPKRLLAALGGGDWTWELWFRAGESPAAEACLVDAGQWDLYCTLDPEVRGLEVVSAPQGIDTVAPVDWDLLTDGGWHHLALTWSREGRRLGCFVDGAPQGPGTRAGVAQARPARVFLSPGLAGEVFAEADLTRPAFREVSAPVELGAGIQRGMGWSERWRGYLIAPRSGEYRLRVETDTGAWVLVDGRAVIEGWEREGARTGTVALEAGRPAPVMVEYTHNGEAVRFRLLWTPPGEAEALIPARALRHSAQDAGAEPGVYRFDLALLGDQNGDLPCDGSVDEMRVSDVVRYEGACVPPGSFARPVSAPAEPSGPPLLFAEEPVDGVYDLGSRRHVFIDDALLEEISGLTIRPCAPVRVEELGVDFDLGDASVLDWEGQVRLYYGGWTEPFRLAVSGDGLRFEMPDLGIGEWGDDSRGMGGNALLRLPGQATFFVDGNPAAPAGERFKSVAFGMSRGIHALMSPDGIHWTRNETVMLPFDCGGGAEGYWDDQRGEYVCHLRHEGHYARGLENLRLAARGTSREFLRPWSFEPAAEPVPRGAFALPALWTELPTPFVPDESGQVYRTRALKYPWAPDVYLAFVWRYDVERQVRQTELAVSRDGRRWRFFGVHPAYWPEGMALGQGLEAKAALAGFGLVRRGDEIWQYGELSTAGHSAGEKAVVRVTQRLDGFACLEAAGEPGRATTHPLRFEGDALEVNAAVRGELRVAVLDRDGAEVPGFGLGDCRGSRGDAVRGRVSWTGGGVGGLRGREVRLRFEMTEGRLFAFRFVEGGGQ